MKKKYVPAAGFASLFLALAGPTSAQVPSQATESANAEAARAAAVREMSAPGVVVLDADREISEVEIDGVIDEAEWQDARVFSGFTQMEPVEGDPAEHDTEVRVLFGDGAVWIAARMWDPDPSRRSRRGSRAGTSSSGTFGPIQRGPSTPTSIGLTGYNFSRQRCGCAEPTSTCTTTTIGTTRGTRCGRRR